MQRLLHDDPNHALAPEVAEIGVIQRFGRLGCDVSSLADRVGGDTFSLQELFSGSRLERVRRHRGEHDATARDGIPVELDGNRRAGKRKVDRAAPPQFYISALYRAIGIKSQ